VFLRENGLFDDQNEDGIGGGEVEPNSMLAGMELLMSFTDGRDTDAPIRMINPPCVGRVTQTPA
jgi:hypothetical protein